MGTPDVDATCGVTTDQDCVSQPGTIGPSDGIGPNLKINANLIMGNAAESGSGGGLRLQNLNGAEVIAFPTTPAQWYSPTITNNIIADNVAGWDGAGVSMVDALNANFINNTVVSNSTTASAGILFTTIGYPLASSEGKNCTDTTATHSCPQVSGLVSIPNSVVLQANLPATVTCPTGHFSTAGGGIARNGTCRTFSYPLLENNIFWQNSAYYIGVGALSAQYQQNVVSLYNAFTTNLAPTQPQADATTTNPGGGVTIIGGTGACVAASYWDIGVRGDTGPINHSSGITLAPIYSVLTSTQGYTSGNSNNTSNNPHFVSQYCDGSRTPPEFGASGWAVPAGISDATVPNPIFNLTPVATVDEGNNWINMRWGPLSLLNPVTNTTLGNYALAANIDSVSTSEPNFNLVPNTDFFGNSRPEPGTTDGRFDPGAVEFASSAPVAALSVTGGPLVFGNQPVGYPSAARTLTLHNTGTAQGFDISLLFSSPVFSRAGGTCTTTLNPGTTCTISVVFTPTATGAVNGTLTIFANVNVTGSPVALSGTGVLPVISATLTPATWTIAQAANCPGSFFACMFDPGQTFTLTNTGNVPLTGITQGTLSGANTADFLAVRLLSTCGPATGGQLVAITTLAPGATCTTFVQFKPLTTEPRGTKTVTLSVGDFIGTQTAALTGTDAPPTLTSIAPTSGVRGTTVPVTLTGTYLDGATSVNAGANITCTIAPPGQTSLTTLTANCAIGTGAALGARTVAVTTPTGTSNTVAFTVTGATVTFAGPTPSLVTGTTSTHSGTITVSNAAAATGPLTLTAAPTVTKTSGPASGVFSIITGGSCTNGTVVIPGGSCTINVQYAPGGSATTATANVTITGSGLATATLADPISAN